jgi:hypothetical protein
MKTNLMLSAATAVLLAAPATAKDPDTCPADMVCASRPGSVAGAMMRAGYQAEIGKDKQGDPNINSAASGYKFEVLFYGCEKAVGCDSLQFYASFANDDRHDVAVANKWNSTKRFGQLAVLENGGLMLTRDLSTMGGLNAKHFTDEMDWWSATLGEFSRFLDANRKPVKPAPAATPAKS